MRKRLLYSQVEHHIKQNGEGQFLAPQLGHQREAFQAMWLRVQIVN